MAENTDNEATIDEEAIELGPPPRDWSPVEVGEDEPTPSSRVPLGSPPSAIESTTHRGGDDDAPSPEFEG